MIKFIRYSANYSLSSAILKLTQFAIFMWLARVLSINEYAMFGLLIGLMQGVQSFSNAGIIETATGIIAKKQLSDGPVEFEKVATSWFMILSILTSGIFFLLFIFVIESEDSQSIQGVIAAIFTGVVLGFSVMKSGCARMNERHTLALMVSVLPGFFGLLLGLCFFLVYESADIFMMAYGAGCLSIIILMLFKKQLNLEIMRDSDGLKDFGKSIPWYLVGALVGWLSGYGANIVIASNFSLPEVAKFTFVLTYSSAVLFLLSAPVQVWTPRFTKLYSQMSFDEIEGKNSRFFAFLSIFIGSVGGLLVTTFPVISTFFIGNDSFYRDLSSEVFILLLGYFLLIPWWQASGHVLANSSGDVLAKALLYSSFFGILLWFVLMEIYGPIGIYLGFSAQMALRSFFLVWLIRGRWKVRIDYISMSIGIMILTFWYIVSFFSANFIYVVGIWAVLFLGTAMLLKDRFLELMDSIGEDVRNIG